MLALIASEPTVGLNADDLNDKKIRGVQRDFVLDSQRCVNGYYRSYTDVAGVEKDSQTKTYVALRTGIDNWRWVGVLIFLRTGKGLSEKITELWLFCAMFLVWLSRPETDQLNPTRLWCDRSPIRVCACSYPPNWATFGTTFT